MPGKGTDFSLAATWRSEIERSQAIAETYWNRWQDNLNSYIGQNPDAERANQEGSNYVNTNADFKNVEVKIPQLFFDTPELQLTASGYFAAPAPAAPPAPPPGAGGPPGMPPMPQGGPAGAVQGAPVQPPLDPAAIINAHRQLLNELLGADGADAMTAVQKAMKAAVAIAGYGPTKIYYEATMETIPTPPEILTAMPEQGPTIERPVHEKFAWDTIPLKKFRHPADFKDSDFDKSPFLAMNFRMPMNVAKRTLDLPENFDEVAGTDDLVLDQTSEGKNRAGEKSSVPYVDGVEIWYYAHIYDDDPGAINPQLIRRHILIDGVDEFVEKDNTNPYQELLPNGRLSPDSMIGYPIHVLCLRDVPDSAFIPSDLSMTRPLARELNTFRTQQVLERDANIPRVGYNADLVPPETIKRIENGTLGQLIAFPGASMAMGMDKLMAQITQGNQTRGSYTANDYIQHDLDLTLGIDAAGAGVQSQGSQTATAINAVEKNRNVRLSYEQKRVLRWYLKGVQKFSALVCKFGTPELFAPIIGQQPAQTWGSWDKKMWDGRFAFTARPDSQLSIDGAAARKFLMDVYQFCAKDPMVNRATILKKISEFVNINPSEFLAPPPPEKKPEPTVGFSFKGDDFVGPQSPVVFAICQQLGIQIPPEAQQQAANQMFMQVANGIRTPDNKPGPLLTGKPNGGVAEHGGTIEKVRPLSQQSADRSGQRTGPKTGNE